jgi:hypothetical protein
MEELLKAIFSMRSVPTLYSEDGREKLENMVMSPVGLGTKNDCAARASSDLAVSQLVSESFTTPRVVNTVKYGHEPRGTRNQE